MSELKLLLSCIGEGVCASGLPALAGQLPLDRILDEVAANACVLLRERQQDEQIRQLLEAAARADPAKVKSEAVAVAEELAGDQPGEVRQRLASWLAQVPALIRQSHRRPSDPAGTSIRARFCLRKPEDLLVFLPARLPRFQAGDRPAGLGDWELTELLGMGGFGEVWQARHLYFDGIAPVAIKFCLDEQARKRLLEHEARVLNQVMRQGRHPGIVPLLDASLSTDPPWLKYEYIAGGDLAGLIRDWPQGDSPRWRTAAQLLLQLAEIIAFAHRLNPPIVHRDLKPANVLLAPWRQVSQLADWDSSQRQDCQPIDASSQNRQVGKLAATEEGLRLLVTDFGIGSAVSGAVAASNTLGTTLRGSHTPLYASPQQMRGDTPDPRDDVHALAIIWYQMLTGDLQSAPTGLWMDDLQEQGMSRELVRLLGACVAKPEKRPHDAGVLAEQLAALLQAPVTQAKPIPAEPPSNRLERFLRTGQTGALAWLLDLTNQRVGDVGAIALASSPWLAQLSALILSGCQLGDEGVRALAASPHVANLNRLTLWDNHIGDEGVRTLAESGFLAHLTTLDLGRNRVGDEGIKALAASPFSSNLGTLILVSNQIGDAGALALAQSPWLANLAELKPLDNRISSVGVRALKATFDKRVRIM